MSDPKVVLRLTAPAIRSLIGTEGTEAVLEMKKVAIQQVAVELEKLLRERLIKQHNIDELAAKVMNLVFGKIEGTWRGHVLGKEFMLTASAYITDKTRTEFDRIMLDYVANQMGPKLQGIVERRIDQLLTTLIDNRIETALKRKFAS